MSTRPGFHFPQRQKRVVNPRTGDGEDIFLGLWMDMAKACGGWDDVPHAAGDFTASGAMTFTVQAADLITFTYGLMGKRLEVGLVIRGASVGGVADRTLRVAIPGNDKQGAALTAARDWSDTVWVNDNGTKSIGIARVSAGGSVIEIEKADGSNWAGAVNTTGVEGTFAFEVN